MTTIKIDLDDDLARHIEESARQEHKSVSEWVKERVKPEADRATVLAGLEAKAVAHGYPPDWITLFGSLADDESFAAPLRGSSRCAPELDTESVHGCSGSWTPNVAIRVHLEGLGTPVSEADLWIAAITRGSNAV